jgi:HEAT repeat protein
VDPLLVALNDRDPDVRRKAVLSLAKIRDPRALEPLRA